MGWDLLDAKVTFLHLYLGLEDIQDKVQKGAGFELLKLFANMAKLLDDFQIHDIIDETQKKAELLADKITDCSLLIVQEHLKHMLQEHQTSAKRCSKFMPNSRCEAL